LARACANCGAQLSATAKFCSECAHPASPAAPPAPQRFGAPETYTPKHLAERIINSKAALEGERKQVTVLFADLKGSMELLADRDPEEARKLLDPVIVHMMEAVHRYEGTVNQVMGDGIMALFGAPLAHEDHAVRACYAALRMQKSLKRFADDTRRLHGVEVQIRVGLNSGEVVVGSVGSDLRMDYTAVGQTTHLAARMEQLALPGTVRLTAETVRLAEGYIEVRSLGPIPVKGLPAPIEIFELTGAGTARSRFQAAALRGLTRFVGRDAEIEHLRRVLDQAAAGRGQIVAIVGEAGVGKSRLVYEFTHSHRVQDWLILEASSVSYGKATSYLPVIDLLKGYFKIGDRDDPREMRAKVLGRVLGLDRALEPLLPPLLALLDVPVEDPAWQNLDPPQRKQRTLDALKRLLLRESQVQPLLVVFEDLHWIDGETQALLDSLVESLSSARLVLLVNYRPEYEHRWGSKTTYSQLGLGSLPAETTAEFLAALLGPHPGLAPLTHMLVKRGNPFFLEETVRSLVETGALAGARGAYRLTRPVEALRVPATVQTILTARIDRLPPEEKRLLQAASVIGKDVPYALLAAIAEQPEEALRHGLAHLQEAEFLYERQLFPDLEYTFKHALTHDVTYGGLLGESRRALHVRVVGAIRALHGDPTAEHLERLAYHAFRGELWQEAVSLLRQVAARAIARSALPESVAYLDQALVALGHLPETREAIETAIDVRVEFQAALAPLAERARMLQYLRDAEPLAQQIGDVRRLGHVSAHMSHAYWFMGQLNNGVQTGERALTIARSLGDTRLELLTRFRLGQIHVFRGRLDQALDRFNGILTDLTGERAGEHVGMTSPPAVTCRALAGYALALAGHFDGAAAMHQEALGIAEASGQSFSIAWVTWAAQAALRLQGDARAAARWAERCLNVSRREGFVNYTTHATAGLGHAYALSGRPDEGVTLLTEALDSHAALNYQVMLPGVLTDLTEALLLAGRTDEALVRAQEALILSRRQDARGFEAVALQLSGEARMAGLRSDAGFAEAELTEALAIAEELGMRPLVAHCHLGLGKLYRRTDKREQAREHLATATTMYREMGMTYWLEKVEAEMGELG
jgi:class 3 adenylate cyclase/tetratricopeptide (TPR) repeat protein